MTLEPVFIDLETRSDVNLRTRGSRAYALGPNTRLLTVAWKDGPDEHIWFPGMSESPPAEYVALHLPGARVHVGDLVPAELCRVAHRPFVGHNAATFDKQVWEQCTEGFEGVRWFDTYPLALACGLPGGLDKIGQTLLGGGKYEAGAKSLKKAMICTGAHDCEPENVPIGQQILVGRYNLQDVRITEAVYNFVQREALLTPHERDVLAAHHAINSRGCRVDRGLVEALIRLSDTAKARAITQIAELTQGGLPDQAAVQSRARVLAWLDAQGFKFSSLRKELVARFIDANAEDEDTEAADESADASESAPSSLPLVVKVLQLRMQALRITGGKLDAALNKTDEDGRMRGLFVYHGAHCVSGDTEVLTETGWQRIDQWTGGKIAQWSLDGRIEFLDATANRFETNEPTVTLNAPYASGVFTLGHHVPTYGWNGKFSERAAGDLVGSYVHMPISGMLTAEGAITPEQMRVLVAVQADGSWVKGRSIRLAFRKRRKVDRAQRILTEAGVVHRLHVFPGDPGVTYVLIRPKDVPVWLTPERKFFGPWLLDSTPGARIAFVEELEPWDGHNDGRGIRYSSKPAANHEWVVTLAHLAGYAAKTGPGHGCAQTIVREDTRAYVKAKHWTESGPIGTVYCPTTQTGYWLCRHNGIISITGNTGRWAGRGLQVQNLPRVKEGCDVWGILGGPVTWDRIASDQGLLATDALGADGKKLYPFLSVDDAASALIRNIFVPDEGTVMAAADYAAIECRVLAWMAGERWLMQALWNGECPYLKMAERIVNKPRDQWPQYPDPKTGKPLPLKKHPYRQIVGKIPELAAGYGVGGAKIEMYAAGMGFSLAEYGVTGADAVLAYRSTHPAICGTQAGEYEGRPYFRGGLWCQLAEAASTAVQHGGTMYAGRCEFSRFNGALIVTLPSGRRLVYRDARVESVQPKWLKGTDKTVETVVYTDPRYGRKHTYGGYWAQNCVQAVARDILAHALVRMEAAGMPVVLHCHDEAVACIKPEQFEGFMQIMSECPPWLMDFPLAVEGSCAPRYAKSPPPGVSDVTWQNGRPK